MKFLRIMEWVAVLYLYQLMLIAGYFFSLSKGNPAVFAVFAERTGILVSDSIFALGSFVGALIAPLVLLINKKAHAIRWTIYVFCAFPLLAYTVPLGVWIYVNGAFSLAPLINIEFFASLFIIGGVAFYSKR